MMTACGLEVNLHRQEVQCCQHEDSDCRADDISRVCVGCTVCVIVSVIMGPATILISLQIIVLLLIIYSEKRWT